jgi:hypothetical protein
MLFLFGFTAGAFIFTVVLSYAYTALIRSQNNLWQSIVHDAHYASLDDEKFPALEAYLPTCSLSGKLPESLKICAEYRSSEQAGRYCGMLYRMPRDLQA